MTPVLHYPLLEPHNARDTAPNEARGADDASPQRAQQGRPRQKSPSSGLPAAFPRKSSPNAPENSVFQSFWACRANFFALTPTIRPRRANFFAHRAQHAATVKPPSPLLAPEQEPLKPTTPVRPKNAPKQLFLTRKGDDGFRQPAQLADRASLRYPWAAAGPGRATSGRPTLQTSSNQHDLNRLARTSVTNVVNPSPKTTIISEKALRLTTFVTTEK